MKDEIAKEIVEELRSINNVLEQLIDTLRSK